MVMEDEGAQRLETAFGQGGLFQQGYDVAPDDIRRLQWGLRFTPAACMALGLVGLATQQPAIHFVLAPLGIVPFWFPSGHPFDVLYNRVLRHLWGGVELPPNPIQRRIACVAGGSMNAAIGAAFVAGQVPAAYALGAILVTLQVVVITTHFCLASWMFEGLLRVLGRWTPPVPVATARQLLASGAVLVDVREPHEFASGSLPAARNIPLSRLPDAVADLASPVVVYCRSGIRSQQAARLLRDQGRAGVHDLGAMARWGR